MSLQLDDELSCSICLELYRSPLTLPCLHSFCAECLRELAQGSNGPTLSCPQCRANIQIPGGGVANFPKNFNLESIVQKVKHHREQRESQSHVKSEGLDDECCYQEEPPDWRVPPLPQDHCFPSPPGPGHRFPPPPRFHHRHHGPRWPHHHPTGCDGKPFHPPHGPRQRHPHGPPPRHHHGHPHHPPPWHHPRGPPP
eukprot:XP_011448032.1 PREDICTED: carboxypeptidase Y [Crassostrea gigas]